MKWLLILGFVALGCAHAPSPRPSAEGRGRNATPAEVIASKVDLWGEAALKRPDGPSYEFFEKLVPPLRYVDADFRCYPIVLSAPGAAIKGRLVSDGSAINALARQPNWRNETGVPVHVLVGRNRNAFGGDLARLTGPSLRDGYLPVFKLSYREGDEVYGEEVFASVDERYPGAILARFEFPGVDQGRVELRLEAGGELLTDQNRTIKDPSGRVLAIYDENWEFNRARSSLLNKVKHAASAVVMIVTPPVESTGGQRAWAIVEEPGLRPATEPTSGPATSAPAPAPASAPFVPPATVDLNVYDQQREQCAARWEKLIASGTEIEVPEAVVNNAWRRLIGQQYEIIRHNQLNYSASNQYSRQYGNESGDTMRSLVLYNHFAPARAGLTPLFLYRRGGIELHDGAFKLEDLADYYFVTRDAALVRELRPLWQREVDLLVRSRKKEDGLFPRERYCSDIETPVLSLNNNANAWRGLRDMSVVLREVANGGSTSVPTTARTEPSPSNADAQQAAMLKSIAAEHRSRILPAMEKSIFRNVDPPFVPVAMGGEETPPDPITSTRMGSYWNLVIPCVLWSEIVPIDSPAATAIIRYIREKGGLCMGMTRVQSPRGFWVNVQNIDDLYLIRYALALLKRDEVDRALVGFYGKLAQGFTRDTFEDGESTGIEPVDEFGRQVALPPNSTANASLLMQLRYLLVQDWDMDGDGKHETLRLCFATPRRWLEDGKKIVIKRAPTAFGEIWMQVESQLSSGQVIARVDMPSRNAPKKTLLRLRLPGGYRIQTAETRGKELKMIDRETMDLSGFRGLVTVTANVARE
jgi:hypothetical protein